MRFNYLIILLIIAFFLLTEMSATTAEPQGSLTIYGYFSLPSQSETQPTIQLLTAKLYPPKERGKPLLLAYSDSASTFRFTDLSPDSYLLEVYLGDQLLYQRLIKLESNILLAIPIGNFKLVDKVTVEERTSQLLRGLDFQGRITVTVGDIDRDLAPNTEPLSLTISQNSRRLFVGKLTPPKLVANFKYNGQTYILAGAVRRTPAKEFIDCEIYR